jgi:hypothetical protein
MTYQAPEVSLLGAAEELVQFFWDGSLVEPDMVTPTRRIY